MRNLRFVNPSTLFGDKINQSNSCLEQELRNNNINAEIFLDTKKNLGKQLTLANKRELDVAIICGENEFKENTVTVKNLKGVKGENNKTFPKANLIDEVKKLI